MPEDLKSLLEHIQKDGVEKAEAEAKRIVDAASKRAADIVKQAEEQAAAAAERGEKEADAFRERATRSLEQAARDVVLSVGENLNAVFRELVVRDVTAALEPDALGRILADFLKAYAEHGGEESGLEVLLAPEQREQAVKAFTAAFSRDAAEGIEIEADESVVAGFRVSTADGAVQHDLTASAIADALCGLLRPHLAEIVKRAVEKQNES